jgi:hypothetical protein
MSSEKFTPGEWKIEEHSMSFGDTERFAFQILTPTKRICQCQTDDAKNIPAMQANARLIAAAPEMYAFIRWIGSVEGQCAILTKDPEIVRKAQQIVKKVRGKNEQS